MPQDNLQNSGERGAQGKYNPLYPGEIGRSLFHPEMDYNLDLIGQVVHGFRVMGTGVDGSISPTNDVNKVLKLYVVTSGDTSLIAAGALVGDRVWIPTTVATTQGDQGAQGRQGDRGPQGRQGDRGFQGAQGAQGFQGTQGPSAVGTPGQTGGTGQQGFQGAQGVQGFQGVQGVQGSVGNYGGDSLRFIVGNYDGNTASTSAITFSNISTLPSPTLTIIVSNTDADGGNVSAWFGSMIALGGSLRITRPGRTTQYLDYKVTSGTTGSVNNILLEYVGGTVSAIGTTWAVGTELIVSYAKTGPQGLDGASANIGYQGYQGYQGLGAQGFQGVQGFQGQQGARGFKGEQGFQGDQGFQGALGYQGYQGYQGNQGIPGSFNAIGDQGYQGYQGQQGTNGILGGAGAQGYQGDQGFQGLRGAYDAIGYQGYQGAQGALGFQGFQGKGDQGFQGNTGSTGNIAGDWAPYNFTATNTATPGPSGSIVTTGGNAFSDITQMIISLNDKNNIDQTSWLTSFGASTNVIKGSILLRKQTAGSIFGNYRITGVTITGTQGAGGYATVSVQYVSSSGSMSGGAFLGTEIMVAFTRAGDQGFQGNDGQSYNRGFQGFQGYQGYQGNQGTPGTAVERGDQGFQGFQGLRGLRGEQGFQGILGFQGLLGDQGFQGIDGQSANIGYQGFQGDLGFQGFQGTDGLAANRGFQGFQGPTGLTGNISGDWGRYTLHSTNTSVPPSGTGGQVVMTGGTTFANTTSMMISLADKNSADQTAWLTSFGASTNTIKGSLLIRRTNDTATFGNFRITGVTITPTAGGIIGYATISLQYVSSINTLSGLINTEIMVSFTRAGDRAPSGNYAFSLTQSGTGDPAGNPTQTVINNTTGLTVSWAYIAAGQYRGTASGTMFPDLGKVWTSSHISTTGATATINVVNGTQFDVYTRQFAGALSDNLLSSTPLKIEIYP